MIKGKIYIVTFFVFFILCLSSIAVADTGIYRILDYTVKLTPHSDGTVEIEYYQKWLVTSGHIPWITIGTANSSYQIDQSKNSGNIRNIYAYNSSGWTGVRIDLDKDYLPDETFEVGFTLMQSKLFYADEDNYKLDFTPGWYDRAVTERLAVTMHIFAPIDRVTAIPRPTRIEGQDIIWEKRNLIKGGKFRTTISFSKTFMPQVKSEVLKSSETRSTLPPILAMYVFFLICFIIFATLVTRGKRYGKGGIIFAAISRGISGKSSGGGGGFGGRSSSCACACVSCACACACAGGGGAGCSKKSYHRCSVCEHKKYMN